MAVWVVAGIGMLVNTIKGNAQKAQQQGQLNQQMQANQIQANKLKASLDKGLNIKSGGIMAGPSMSIHVDYPDKAFDNLNKMQTGNLSEKMGLQSSMRKELGAQKEAFFKENHLKTEFGSQGTGKLVLDEAGKPQVGKGAESAEHRTVREGYESQNRLALANKHAEQLDKFTKAEAEKTKLFLQENAAHLNDPAVQSELQKMIVNGKKKSLKIHQDQDEERWRADLPPDEGIQTNLEMGMQDMRQMDQRHVEAEEKSPDLQQILDYNREFAAAAAEEKNIISAKKSDENFLLDPRKMMAMASDAPKQRFDQVLPGHLTASIFQMGVYEV